MLKTETPSASHTELEERRVYFGAGTPGRLGVIDSVELYPTFSWPQERAVGLIAGVVGAMALAQWIHHVKVAVVVIRLRLDQVGGSVRQASRGN